MIEPSEAKATGSPLEIALYIDTSALAKLYVPERVAAE
jgi:hypothetical protein